MQTISFTLGYQTIIRKIMDIKKDYMMILDTITTGEDKKYSLAVYYTDLPWEEEMEKHECKDPNEANTLYKQLVAKYQKWPS